MGEQKVSISLLCGALPLLCLTLVLLRTAFVIQEDIRAVLVWPKWLRICHALLAVGVGFQLISAWLLKNAAVDALFWSDWHTMVGQVLVFVLALRVYLAFVHNTGHWRQFIGTPAQRRGAVQMVKFYLTFGRFPLPKWYAYNPLWMWIYPVIWGALAISVASGLGIYHAPWVGATHVGSGALLGALTILHVITVFLHDSKGQGGDISAILNGVRYFHTPSSGASASGQSASKNGGPEVYVPLGQIKTRPKKKPD